MHLFPLYRLLSDGSSLYIIRSSSVITEYKKLGQKCMEFTLEAKILPDRNFIADLIGNNEGRYENISLEQAREWCLKHGVEFGDKRT